MSDTNLIDKTKESIVKALDLNGNGEIDLEDIIRLSFKIPGIHVTRASFLQKELYKNHPQAVINKAIATTPAQAGISAAEINHIADEVIIYERNCVSGISTALGVPGGFTMAVTIPAELVQYHGYMLRAAQKLLYLYGFPEVNSGEDRIQLDTETVNQLSVCFGVMYGVAGANNAIKAMANSLSIGIEKKLLNTALTKGTFYPLVKAIAKWFGIKMTKSIFAGFFKKAIPILGGLIGGCITFFSFKPCCNRLKATLQDTMLSNPNHKSTPEEDSLVNSIKNETFIDADYKVVSSAEKNSDNETAPSK